MGLTDEQQTYLHNLNDWYEAQAELLSTEMLVDINKQISALEAQEKGPLTTIKDAIQKYADDFEELGTLTDDAQARLDKLSGLQLDKARKDLYSQLLTPDEIRARDGDELTKAFANAGQAMPATTDALRDMVDAAQAAGNTTLADSLLELVPAFVSLQDAAGSAVDGMSEAMKRLQAETASLEIELMRAQGNTSGADSAQREIDIKDLTQAEVAVYDYNAALRAQISALQERTGLQDALNRLTLTSAELRALEIAKLDESNRPLQERIWLLEEEKRIAAERNGLMSSLYQVLGNTGALRAEQLAKLDPTNQALQQQIWQIEDAKTALEKALQAESESANAAQQAAQERVSTLQSIFDTLKSNVDSLYESVEATKEWTAAQANAFIDNALSNARATGYMPELGDLNDAMAGARGGLDKQYASEFERQRETLVLAGKLSELQAIAGPQPTTAEQQLKVAKDQVESLDALQKQGRAMLDSLSGNVAATLSVRDAIAQLSAAVLSMASAASAAAQTTSATAAVSGQLATAYGSSNVTSGSSSHTVVSPQLSATRVLSADGKAIVLDVGSSWSQDQIAAQVASNLAAYSATGNQSNYDTLLAYAKENKIPGFAQGINFVPYDMTARIHKGEAVIPERFNPFNPGAQFGNSNTEMVAEMRALRAEVAALRAAGERTASNTAQMADQFDSVTEGGNAMRSEVMA